MPSPVGRRNSGGLAAKTGFVGSVARFWRKTYAPDYMGLAFLVTAYILLEFFADPFHRMFTLNNISLQYPHALQERVPIFWMFGYALGIPLIVLSLWLVISKSSAHKAHVTFLGLSIGCILTSFITDLIKNAVGRPRPDLISRCKPKPGTPDNQLVTFEVCTETDHHILHDGWRSFPSGHSSFAFAGLGFLALFLAGQMHVFRPRTDLFRGLVALTPLLGAAMIAISRCEDYRHDVYDVTVGSILGMSIGYFSYRRYYRRLRHPQCHEPFKSRAASAEEGFAKVKDDEEAVRAAGDYVLGSIESDEER